MNWNRTKALGLLAAALCTAMPLHQPVSLWQCVQAEESLRSQLNMLSYSVTNSKGETVQKWHPGETRDVRVILKNAGLKTSAVVPADQLKTGEKISCIDVDLVYCGFSTEKTPEVVLLSSAGQPLKFEVIFRDVKWKGESDSFAYTVGYSETSLPYDKETIGISQVVLPQPEPDTPVTPDTPDIPDTPSEPDAPEQPDDGGDSWNGGWTDDGGSDPDDGAQTQTISAAAPNIIIQKYTYGSDAVEAGKTFDLDIQFYNTSKELSVENIVMSVETEEGLSIANSSNTYYFETLGPRKALSQKLSVKALGTDQSSSPTIAVSFRYEYVDGSSRIERNSSERIAIPVYQPDRLEITEPALPEEIYAGSETALSFPYVNKGKGTLYNVTARVEGDMESLLPVQNLGNFEPGKSGTIDMILVPESAGEHSFKVVITYENTNGDEIKREFPFTADVLEGGFGGFGEDDFTNGGMIIEPEPEQSGFPWWILILAAAAGLGGWFFWKKKKKPAASQQNLDDLDDFFRDEDEPEEAAALEAENPEAMKEKTLEEAQGGEADAHEIR